MKITASRTLKTKRGERKDPVFSPRPPYQSPSSEGMSQDAFLGVVCVAGLLAMAAILVAVLR